MSAHTLPGFSKYKVLPTGAVISLQGWKGIKERSLHFSFDDDGYPCVRMVDDNGIRHRKAVHRLVAEVHIGPRPSARHEVRHLDGDKKNPHVNNLAWGTRQDNADDREEHGRTSRNGKHSEAIRAGQANARLIAAAPDLLQALRGLLDAMAEHALLANAVWVDQRIAIARAAIAKAEGGI